eukprot:g3156.t1
MTSLTGRTAAQFKSSVHLMSPTVALAGAAVQLSAVLFVWSSYTSAKSCTESFSKLEVCLSGNVKDAWSHAVGFCLLTALITWIVSMLIGKWGSYMYNKPFVSDTSIVDRLWSIIPVVYVWGFYFASGDAMGNGRSNRLLLMASLCTIWGTRLTINFAVKGGYTGGEDYRWKEVRRWFKAPSLQFEVFNLLFVCFYQHVLLLAQVSPAAIVVMLHKKQEVTSLGTLDYIAAVLILGFILVEFVADRQMLRFQTEKYRRLSLRKRLPEEREAFINDPNRSVAREKKKAAFRRELERRSGFTHEEINRGFYTGGLYAYSRHPNYFAEVSIWWCFYLFSLSGRNFTGFVNWTIVGAIALTLLFVPPGASIDLTEMLSSSKYPEYRAYQKRVSRFFPWFSNST